MRLLGTYRHGVRKWTQKIRRYPHTAKRTLKSGEVREYDYPQKVRTKTYQHGYYEVWIPEPPE